MEWVLIIGGLILGAVISRCAYGWTYRRLEEQDRRHTGRRPDFDIDWDI